MTWRTFDFNAEAQYMRPEIQGGTGTQIETDVDDRAACSVSR